MKHKHLKAHKTHKTHSNKKQEVQPYVEPKPYAMLGHKPEPHQPDGIWVLDVLSSVPHIDPITYFKTSGDAVIKAERLEADLWQAAAKARCFANALRNAKGKNKHLETEWLGNGVLCCKVKNARPNPRLLQMKPGFNKPHHVSHYRG